MALLALCNSLPLLAHCCAPDALAQPIGTSNPCVDAKGRCPTPQAIAPCCLPAENAALLVSVAAPLPVHSLDFSTGNSLEAVSSPTLNVPIAVFKSSNTAETDLPPPRELFDCFRSCRAPPSFKA